MMGKRFTPAYIANLSAPQGKRIDVFDPTLPSFGIRVSGKTPRKPGGKKSWFVFYRLGKQKRLTFEPPYPTLGIAAARKKAGDALAMVSDGNDPAQAKAVAKAEAERAAADTVKAVVETFIRRHLEAKGRAPSYIDDTKRAFNLHVLPIWGSRPIGTITRRDVSTLLNGICDQGKPIAANRTLSAVRAMGNWALRQGLIEANPAALVERPGTETKRERTLSADEIRGLWPAFDALGYPFGSFFAMALVTGQRRDEVAGMKWSEIKPRPLPATDANVTPLEWVWVLEGDRTKSGRPHAVPLSPLAMTTLAGLPHLGVYVFTTTGDRPISGYSKAKADLDRAVAETRKKAKDLPSWTIHDLRRTCATEMARLGIGRLTISKILNHSDASITGVYDRFDYLPEKRHALDTWGAYLVDLTGPPAASNVETLAKHRGAA
jgi:integrase